MGCRGHVAAARGTTRGYASPNTGRHATGTAKAGHIEAEQGKTGQGVLTGMSKCLQSSAFHPAGYDFGNDLARIHFMCL